MGHERARWKAGSTPNWRSVCTPGGVIVRLLRACPSAARASGLLLVLSFISVLFGAGCTHVPAGRSAVKSVELTGNDVIDADDLREKLATTSSPKFLGLFRGVVYEYSVFDRFVLERDLQRIERYYRAVGFYHARARAGRVFFVEPNKVRVDIRIEEGEPMLIGRVDIHGIDGLSEERRKRIVRRIKRQLCGKEGCSAVAGSRPFEEE